MPRTKGSKNKPKTVTADFATQIAEKQSAKEALTAEIASITANIDTLKADLKEKKTAVDVRLVMPSVQKRLFLWSRMKKALNIHRLMKINVFIVISVSRYVQSKQQEHSEEES